MSKKKESQTQSQHHSRFLRDLQKAHRITGNDIQRISDPFNPEENNVFNSQQHDTNPKQPTPFQIQRAIRGRS